MTIGVFLYFLLLLCNFLYISSILIDQTVRPILAYSYFIFEISNLKCKN